IRALADAPYRASHAWRRRELADPGRVERYARFLARHFYYERIVHFFKYSRALARVTGRAPEAVLTSPAFDALLPTLVLGSGEPGAGRSRDGRGHGSLGPGLRPSHCPTQTAPALDGRAAGARASHEAARRAVAARTGRGRKERRERGGGDRAGRRQTHARGARAGSRFASGRAAPDAPGTGGPRRGAVFHWELSGSPGLRGQKERRHARRPPVLCRTA